MRACIRICMARNCVLLDITIIISHIILLNVDPPQRLFGQCAVMPQIPRRNVTLSDSSSNNVQTVGDMFMTVVLGDVLTGTVSKRDIAS